jgi:anti-sigma factor RsiW
MASLGREAAALRREAAAAAEAERWKQENKASKRRGVRNAVVTGAICFVVGALAGGGAIFVIGGR